MPPKKKLGRPRKDAKASQAAVAVEDKPGETKAKKAPVMNLSALIAGMQDYRPVEWIRTGIPAIDLIIGAGIPRGRFIEIMGDPSTAKSVLGFVAIGAFQRAGGQCILMDSEKKTDKEFAQKMGVEWSKLGYPHIENLDTCIQILGKVATMADPKIPTLVVWDSLAGTRGINELEEAMSDEGMKSERGQRAKYFSAAMRAVMGELSDKNVTLIGINQLRVNFNFMSGYTTTDSPGGKALKFHSAVRIHMAPRGRIRDKVRDLITGMTIECEAKKNQVAIPHRKAELKFYFDTGFAPYSGLDELLLRHGRLVQAAGWLCYGSKKFRAGDIERIVAEVPEILNPIQGTLETGGPPPEPVNDTAVPAEAIAPTIDDEREVTEEPMPDPA